MDISRRRFIKTTSGTLAIGVAGAAAALKVTAADQEASSLNSAHPEEQRRGDMVYRRLGRSGEWVSLVGLGGYHMGKQVDENESIHLVRSAIDRGITFMDNCWDYNSGESEIRMGKALRDGYREKVFLMTKIDGRSKEEAGRQIEDSLKRLQTDHIDLLQHHEVIRLDDADRIFAEGGAQEAVLEAKKAGKIRYIGFTGHKDPFVHLRMLQAAGDNGFRFDTVQMPLNVMDGHEFRSFERQVLPVLVKENIGVLGMKPLGDNFIVRSKTVTPIEALHYTMSLPTSVVITGIDKPEILDQALEAVRTFKRLDQSQLAAMLARTKIAATKGEFELYKTSTHFDGTIRNPQWLG
ncbi:MAG TPA: aldo/keto reductase [Chthoniobacterales bacterium]|jgi:aryl-alcohol dehydrogenase-like predicted oxidoreductase|nr:aldo/keto reductase [Chthoniobacterales bacterium]